MNDTSRIIRIVWRLLFAAALVAAVLLTEARASQCNCAEPSLQHDCVPVAAPPVVSWIFAPSRYTHDPMTGARVAQYARNPPVEPLPDPRLVTSGYSRTRTVLRGADGSTSTYYQVQNYGNGRGQMDAEWERYHDAWRGSTTAGGNFYGAYGFGGFPGAYGPGFGGPGFGGPGFGGPGYGFHPGRFPHSFDYGHYNGGPDSRRLDPDGADGYPDGSRRTPDRQFFRYGTPNGDELHDKDHKGH